MAAEKIKMVPDKKKILFFARRLMSLIDPLDPR